MSKKINTILFFLFLSSEAFAIDSFMVANDKFQTKDYPSAIDLYTKSLSEFQSMEQHYNLANAYYKNNQFGPAILHYKKALAIAPMNKDVLSNLELSQIAAHLGFEKRTALARFAETFSVNFWSITLSLAFWLFLGITLLAPLYKWNSIIKIITQTLALTLLGLCLSSLYYYHTERNLAVVLNPNIALQVSPIDSSPCLCTLKEGCCAKICKEHEDYCFVETNEAQRGWVQKSALARIWE